MNSTEIRNSFLDYFKKHGHRIVPSDSLIPSSDPSLLFTSAGMVQFKKHFLGDVKTDFTRAVSCQKCFRTSDIDQVGLTLRHLTFFEMLGNFSFGDYFKEDAIYWAWEYLTDVLKLPKKNLYISVFKEDDESYGLWKKHIPENRIIALGEDSNFWHMGPTGPCGPCSEILFDLGKQYGCGKASCAPGCDCDRYVEIWNLVFTQFDRLANGALKSLPKKNIDTGMGLERLVYVVQGKSSPFETDLFAALFDELGSKSGFKAGNKKYTASFRLIADHIRAITLLISDGILPSNEGRGYVLRRLVRRATRAGKRLSLAKPFLFSLTPVVTSIMKSPYPELADRRENIASIVKLEEEKFHETLETGMRHLDEIIAKFPGIIPGEEVFKLYDTFGFPIELTKEIAAESKRTIDEDGFHKSMEKAQSISRKHWKGSGEEDVTFFSTLHKKYGDTVFLGYETVSSVSRVVALIQSHHEIKSLKKGEEADIVLNQTPCYGEAGGQTGDTGTMNNAQKKITIDILQTVKPLDGLIVHRVKIHTGMIQVGDTVSVKVNEDTRTSIMRHHTSTHLLHKALRQVLGKHVVQSGSLVTPDRLRFDYTHPGTPKKDEISRVEELVNDSILQNLSVNTSEITLSKARALGVMALFGEKYGSKVRCVYIGDDITHAYCAELCGGTHMKSTGGIGMFKIVSDASIASGVRRIEAVAGKKAYAYIKNTESFMHSLSDKLKVSVKDIPARIDKLIENQKSLEKQITKFKDTIIHEGKDENVIEKDFNGKKVRFIKNDMLDIQSLRKKADIEKNEIKSYFSTLTTNTSYIFVSSEEAQKEGFDANFLIKKYNKIINGSGGGRKDFAQGGNKDASLITKASFERLLKEIRDK